MAEKSKKTEPKKILEREYTIPLRKAWLKVAKYKRANRAIKEIKRFLLRHMKVYDDDSRLIKIDKYLNNEVRFRGMRKPPAKIRVKAEKFDDGTVRAYLSNIPKVVKFRMERENKIKEKASKVIQKKEEAKAKEKKSEEEKDKKEEIAKEKEETSKEAMEKIAKEEAKEMKHVSTDQQHEKDRNISSQRAQRGR